MERFFPIHETINNLEFIRNWPAIFLKFSLWKCSGVLHKTLIFGGYLLLKIMEE